MNDWNTAIIEEFHANGGKVGGPFEGGRLLLLTTTGAKSGKRSTSPLAYLRDGDRLIIIASAAGAPKHPAWYHNLVAHPQVTVEVGNEAFDKIETFDLNATVLTGEERDQMWKKVVERHPGFADYQTKTTRLIPVIALNK